MSHENGPVQSAAKALRLLGLLMEAHQPLTLAALSKRAREVESDPCEIKSTFTEVEGGVQLDIDFIFSCEAESLIFQLGLR